MIPLIWIICTILLLLITLLLIIQGNPIYKIINLIILFMLGAFLFILLDFYFIGLTFFIVYIGAIAILFLFVIMMVNIKNTSKIINIKYLKNISLFGILLLILSIINWSDDSIYNYFFTIWSNHIFSLTDIQIIGYLIYLAYPLSLILMSYLLWLILIGILIITLN
jgi:NADH:ubiquinone oxidoreductase subunit 6 (subunit J)